MNFLDRFAADRRAEPASLQLLFAEWPSVPAERLAVALRAYHPDLSGAGIELRRVADLPGDAAAMSAAGPPATELGLVEWGPHVVKLAVFEAPMPSTATEACLRAALLPPEVKADARSHGAHVLLYYAGAEEQPLEQRVALAAVAAALAEFGAIVTLNEEARAAVLSTDLLPDQPGEDMMLVLRSLPLPYLYAGFAKLVLTDLPGVWMRTFAAHRLNLPDLACHAEGHDEGQSTFQLFHAVLEYLRETGLALEAGEAIRIDDDRLLSVRAPEAAEWWLDSPGTLWVLERAATV